MDFFVFLERIRNIIIDLGFQSAVPMYYSNNSEVILFKDIMSKNENRKVQNYNKIWTFKQQFNVRKRYSISKYYRF